MMHTTGSDKIPWDDTLDIQYYRLSGVKIIRYQVKIVDVVYGEEIWHANINRE